MIRPILKYGAPQLEIESESVTTFDQELEQLTRDLFETMYAAPGIGLAAPQVGVNILLIVIDLTSGKEKDHQIVMVNPEIVEEEGTQREEEGCLSIPGFTAIVARPSRLRVVAQDLKGQPIEMTCDQLLARAVAHEVDHLNGILYLDRISVLKRDLIRRKIRKLARSGAW